MLDLIFHLVAQFEWEGLVMNIEITSATNYTIRASGSEIMWGNYIDDFNFDQFCDQDDFLIHV